jgi:hypothetical protein
MKNPMDTFILSQKWTRRFLASHVAGWVFFSLQTLWIVWEVRRKKQ